MRKSCAVLAVTGRTAPIKDELIRMGFKYNGQRRSWAKFKDAEFINELKEEGRQLALAHLGEVLIDTFISNQITTNEIPF